MPYPFEWVAQGLLVSLALGLALSAAVGVLLIVRPDISLRIHARSSRWVDTRRFLEKLNRAWYLEASFYRHHRLLGGSMMAGAAYVLWSWLQAYDRMQVLSLAPQLRAQALDWIVAGLESTVVAIHFLALLLGLVIWARPSLIKGLEARANHWYGPQGFAAVLDRQYDAMNRWLALYPRRLGVLALGGSAYALVALYPPLLSAFGA